MALVGLRYHCRATHQTTRLKEIALQRRIYSFIKGTRTNMASLTKLFVCFGTLSLFHLFPPQIPLPVSAMMGLSWRDRWGREAPFQMNNHHGRFFNSVGRYEILFFVLKKNGFRLWYLSREVRFLKL
jgi:hypothetical protein